MKYINNPNTKCTCSNPKHHAFWILNKKNIITSIKRIIETQNINYLTKDCYDFLHNLSGFIAHYDINGFMDYYNNIALLVKDLQNSSDLSDFERYITDKYFSEGEQKMYYADKAEVLKNIKSIVDKIKVKEFPKTISYTENILAI